jgi:DNA-binding response OmpR family regulator
MKILIISSDRNLREVLKFCFEGWAYEVTLLESAPSDVMLIKRASPDVIVVDVHAAKRPDLEICKLLKDDFITAFIPMVTLIDKRHLRSQLFNIKQGVDDYLIKPPDPLDLRVRVEMAIKRSQYGFRASPLTGLPGGRVIEEMVRDRLGARSPFSFGYLDLDNFKSFNDAYGYVKGDRIIMQTAYMLYSAISAFGNRDDFIGHIGGDDFAFITTPGRYPDICHNFITQFNRIVPFHYSPEDRARGYIVAKDRTHKVREIPLMSVSVAIVNAVKNANFKNMIEINVKVAEVKRYLKTFEGSKFMADRRSETLRGAAGPAGKSETKQKPEIYKQPASPASGYRPLGQILLESGAITADKLDEALTVHWRRGIRLGEVLLQLNLVGQNKLADALMKSQERCEKKEHPAHGK